MRELISFARETSHTGEQVIEARPGLRRRPRQRKVLPAHHFLDDRLRQTSEEVARPELGAMTVQRRPLGFHCIGYIDDHIHLFVGPAAAPTFFEPGDFARIHAQRIHLVPHPQENERGMAV